MTHQLCHFDSLLSRIAFKFKYVFRLLKILFLLNKFVIDIVILHIGLWFIKDFK